MRNYIGGAKLKQDEQFYWNMNINRNAISGLEELTLLVDPDMLGDLKVGDLLRVNIDGKFIKASTRNYMGILTEVFLSEEKSYAKVMVQGIGLIHDFRENFKKAIGVEL